MKFQIAFIALCIGISHAQLFGAPPTSEEIDFHFQKFKVDYERTYESPAHERMRRIIFAENLAYIKRHNAQAEIASLHTYTLGVNQFADMTNDEYRQLLARSQVRTNRSATHTIKPQHVLEDVPDAIDWVSAGKVTPVKNQGQCGSVVVFAAVATIESANAIAKGELVDLSEAEIEDCCGSQSGCQGSPMSDDDVFKCVINMKGIDTGSSYPAPKGQCAFDPKNVGAILTNYYDVLAGSESALHVALSQCPVAAEIDAGHISFQLYTSGVYNEPACQTNAPNHAVAIVGSGTTADGTQWWKVKNSWGAAWGEQGYMRMSRNANNQCGIASFASYPIV